MSVSLEHEEEEIVLPEMLDCCGTVVPIVSEEVNVNFTPLEKSVNKIRRIITDINHNFLLIGQELAEIKDKRLFSPKYKSFEDFVKFEFNLALGTAYSFIRVRDFYIHFDNDINRDKFSFSQLLVMSSIDKNDKDLLKQIIPEMSVASIRHLKKEYYKQKRKEFEDKYSNLIDEEKTSKKEKKEKELDDFVSALNQLEDSAIQPLALKNKEERLKFLDSYRSWELIANIDYLRLKVYRRRLKNKTSVVCFCAERVDLNSSPSKKFCIFIEPENNINYGYRFCNAYFDLFFNSETEVVDFLTKNKSEIE